MKEKNTTIDRIIVNRFVVPDISTESKRYRSFLCGILKRNFNFTGSSVLEYGSLLNVKLVINKKFEPEIVK